VRGALGLIYIIKERLILTRTFLTANDKLVAPTITMYVSRALQLQDPSPKSNLRAGKVNFGSKTLFVAPRWSFIVIFLDCIFLLIDLATAC